MKKQTKERKPLDWQKEDVIDIDRVRAEIQAAQGEMGRCGHRRLREEPEPSLAEEKRTLFEGYPAPEMEKGAQDISGLQGRGLPRPLDQAAGDEQERYGRFHVGT